MPEGDTNTTSTSTTNTKTEITTPKDFESFISGQPDEVKALYNGHIAGLRNTVAATRTERDAQASKVAELLKVVEKGSETEKQLTALQQQLATTSLKADFMADAVKPEVQCRNPRAAYALMVSENLVDKKGNPDWVELKKVAPELFGVVAPKANAGNGTDTSPKSVDMNSLIRQRAGRK